jgi:hypothetical protein
MEPPLTQSTRSEFATPDKDTEKHLSPDEGMTGGGKWKRPLKLKRNGKTMIPNRLSTIS